MINIIRNINIREEVKKNFLGNVVSLLLIVIKYIFLGVLRGVSPEARSVTVTIW